MKSPSRYAIALTAALGLFMAVLDTTIVNVGLVPIAKAFNTDINTVQWVITGYLLAQAALIPVSGYLSNRFGQRRVFVISLTFFTIGSLLCGLAPNEEWLIAFRVVQGIGGGAIFPVGQAIAFGAFPPEKRAAATPIVGIPILMAPAFGPTIGGIILDNWGWQYMFYINIPVGIVALALAFWIIPADLPVKSAKTARRFDYVGLVLSMLGILAVVYSFNLVSEVKPGTQTALNPQGAYYGWDYWLVWTLMGGGALLLAVFAWYELKISRDPVIELRLFKDYNFSVGAIVIWFASIVLFSSLLLIPVFMQQVRQPHLNAVDTGLTLMPMGIGAFLGVAFAGRFFNRLGVRNLVLIGTLILIGSTWPLMNFQTTTDGWSLWPWLLLRGLSFGMVAIPVQTLATQRLVGPDLAKGTSLFNMIRQIAQSVGNALIISLFAQQTIQHATDLSSKLLGQLPKGVTLDPNNPQFAALRDQLLSQAGTQSVNDLFTILIYAGGLMLLIALVLPGRKKQLAEGAGAKPSVEGALAG